MAKREPLSVLIIGHQDYDKERRKGGTVPCDLSFQFLLPYLIMTVRIINASLNAKTISRAIV